MNKPQLLGLLRGLFTAFGTMLAVHGLSDGNNWQPVAGIGLALASLFYGMLYHKDPENPGKLRWSLVRKLVNVTGSAMVMYGYTRPEKVEAIVAAVAAMGPFFALFFSFVDNTTPDDDEPFDIKKVPLWLLLACAGCLLLPGCAGFPITAMLDTHYGSATLDAKGQLVIAPKARPITIPIHREK